MPVLICVKRITARRTQIDDKKEMKRRKINLEKAVKEQLCVYKSTKHFSSFVVVIFQTNFFCNKLHELVDTKLLPVKYSHLSHHLNRIGTGKLVVQDSNSPENSNSPHC